MIESSWHETGPSARIACLRTRISLSLAKRSSSDTPNRLRTSEPRMHAAAWNSLHAKIRRSRSEL